MAEIDIRSLAVCIQALQRAIRFQDFLSQSRAGNADEDEDGSYMYEQELSRLIGIYRKEELAGRANVPLAKLLHPPFDALLRQLTGRRAN